MVISLLLGAVPGVIAGAIFGAAVGAGVTIVAAIAVYFLLVQCPNCGQQTKPFMSVCPHCGRDKTTGEVRVSAR